MGDERPCPPSAWIHPKVLRLDRTLRMVKTKGKALRKGCRLLIFSLWRRLGKETCLSIRSHQIPAVHLSRKRNTNINKGWFLDGNHTIKAQKSGILLGVEIDNQLKWKNPLDRIGIRASKSITTLSCLAGSVWGGKLKFLTSISLRHS